MTKIETNSINFYPPLIDDYINGRLKEKGIVNWDYSLQTILEKAKKRKFTHREILTEALQRQNSDITLSEASKKNLALLQKENCLTVCTGHQLSLLGGPAYFVSKIIDGICLANRLNNETSDFQFVPIFWMATEDHDFEEIKRVSFFNKQFSWEKEVTGGPVGRLNPDALDELLSDIKILLGASEKAKALIKTFERCYLRSNNLAKATRKIVNELLGEHGILILDGDDKKLKRLAKDLFKTELEQQLSRQSILAQNDQLSAYKIQAHAREINLFHLSDNKRVRITRNDDSFGTADNSSSWSKEELGKLCENNTEELSPNVVLRPLYQESILPNVAYIGGAGEIAYWLQLTASFKRFAIQMPVPVVRNSYLYLSAKEQQLLLKASLNEQDLFKSTNELEKEFITSVCDKKSDIEEEKQDINKVFDSILSKSKKISPDLERSIEGERQKTIKSILNLEKKLEKGEKRLHEDHINRIKRLKNIAFPEGTFQERKTSFFDFYLKSTQDVVELTKAACEPFDQSIKVVVY